MHDDLHKHYQEIADMIDSYPEMDRDFMLWYLLGNYRKYLDRCLEERANNPHTLEEYAVRRMMCDHFKATEDIRNVLQETIF